jgi:hypothetical protein
MKKVFALAFVAAMVTLASCGEKKTEGTTDSTAAAVDSSVAAPADSASADSATAAPADSAK